MGKEYDDNDDFSIYDADLEEMANKRRMRKKSGKKASFADTYAADMEEETIKIKSGRPKRSFENAETEQKESFSDKYNDDFDEDIYEDIDEDIDENISENEELPDEDTEDDPDGDFDEYAEDTDEADELQENGSGDTDGQGSAAAVVTKNAETAAPNENSDNKDMKKKKKPMSLKRKFFTILASILGIYAVLLVAFIIINYSEGGDPSTPPTPGNVIKTVAEKTGEVVVGKVPDRTTVLMMVIDKEYSDETGEYQYPRTDSLVLANYDNVNKRLSLMSIPRDTIVEVSDEMFAKMRSEFPEPGKKQMKINAIYHYGGKDHGIEYLETEIERMFGVKPDYYVCVNFDGFNYIVDSIGGVEFDVPIDMKYDDPYQNLHIDIKKGLQVLDGDKAQQFVRYRKDNYGNGYSGGDIERIAVQQAFVKALMAKASKSDTVFKNIFSYLNAFNKYVKTDATVNDMARYATVLKSIDMNNVITETLPGQPAYMYGISGYKVNDSEAAAMVYNIFKRPLNEITAELAQNTANPDVESSADKTIKILNGGYTNGMASEIQNRLNEKGIPVAEIGTYEGEKKSETQIFVSREGIGLDLPACFDKTANVIVDEAQTTANNCDILIVIGIDEPLARSSVQSSSSANIGEIPFALSLITGDGSDYSQQSSTSTQSYDYTDYDFDDEDEDNEDEDYSEEDEDTEDTDHNEDEDNDTSNISNTSDNTDNYDDADEDEEVSDEENEEVYVEDTDDNNDYSEPEESYDEPEPEPEPEADYDYYEESVN